MTTLPKNDSNHHRNESVRTARLLEIVSTATPPIIPLCKLSLLLARGSVWNAMRRIIPKIARNPAVNIRYSHERRRCFLESASHMLLHVLKTATLNWGVEASHFAFRQAE